MIEILRTHHISLPPQVGLLVKVLISLEGSTQLLSPKFSLMELMRPFHRKMLLRRLSPRRRLQKLHRAYVAVEQLAEIVPQRIVEIMDQIQAGKFDVHLDHRGLEPSVNRLVMGMLASALFLGSALLLSTEVFLLFFRNEIWYFGLHRISIVGLAGCLVSILLGLRVTRAIRHSGKLDRHNTP